MPGRMPGRGAHPGYTSSRTSPGDSPAAPYPASYAPPLAGPVPSGARNRAADAALPRPADVEWGEELDVRRVRGRRQVRRAGLAGRIGWMCGGLLLGLLGGAVLFGSSTPPAGLRAAAPVHEAAPLPQPPGPPASVTGPDVSTLRADAAAEAARLAALREARLRLEAELEVLRQDAEARRRVPPPGRKSDPAEATGAEATARVPAVEARVFVHHRAGSALAARAAEEVEQDVRGAGFEVAGIRPVPFAPAARVVRYFHDEDAGIAARLAARLGPGWAIQDFRAFQPQPQPHTLEIWLPAN